MMGGCEAGKHQQALFPTVRAPDAGKATHRIAAVQILLDHILDHRTEIPVLLLEPILIFSKKTLEIIKEYPVKNRVFRMALAVDEKSLKDWIRLEYFSEKSGYFL